jgi:hypothetical protein
VLRVLFRRGLRPIITVGVITHITTGATTTAITLGAITTDTTATGTIIGTGLGSPGHAGIIAIGKPLDIMWCRGPRSPLFESPRAREPRFTLAA